MARGRRKSLTKKIVREHKYNPPSVDYDSLEEELHEQLINPNADSGPVVPVWYEEPENKDKPVTATMDEDEIDAYAAWAQEVAEKAEAANECEIKAHTKANAESLAKIAKAAVNADNSDSKKSRKK